MTLRLIAATIAAAMVAACGGGGGSTPSSPTPTQTTPPTPTVTALRIDGLDAIRTGFFSDYTATATLSNGTTQTVTPTWTSSNSSVATVDSSGRLTGINHGTVSLTATHQGAAATKNVSIVANFGGTWSGRYVMRVCDQSGAFATIRYCQGLGGVGSQGAMGLSLTQSGNDRTQISGAISFGSLTGNVTGNVTGDGRLVLGSNFTVTASGVTFSFRIGGWETRLSGSSNMTGRWADNLAAIGVAGNAYTENEIVTLTRTAVADTPPPVASTTHYFLDLRDFFAAMRRH